MSKISKKKWKKLEKKKKEWKIGELREKKGEKK